MQGEVPSSVVWVPAQQVFSGQPISHRALENLGLSWAPIDGGCVACLILLAIWRRQS